MVLLWGWRDSLLLRSRATSEEAILRKMLTTMFAADSRQRPWLYRTHGSVYGCPNLRCCFRRCRMHRVFHGQVPTHAWPCHCLLAYFGAHLLNLRLRNSKFYQLKLVPANFLVGFGVKLLLPCVSSQNYMEILCLSVNDSPMNTCLTSHTYSITSRPAMSC